MICLCRTPGRSRALLQQQLGEPLSCGTIWGVGDEERPDTFPQVTLIPRLGRDLEVCSTDLQRATKVMLTFGFEPSL